MTDPHDTIAIENVVASSDLGQELDLAAVAEDLSGTKFNPDHFPGLVYRMQEPKAASLLFRSGKSIVQGRKASSTSLPHSNDWRNERGYYAPLRASPKY